MKLRSKTGGRVAGTPNKATYEARQAIGAFVDGNANRLNEWLDAVANGIREIDPLTGMPSDTFLVRPNPAKAFEMFHSLLEFHVPKLTRVQVSGNECDPQVIQVNMGVFTELLKDLKKRRQLE